MFTGLVRTIILYLLIIVGVRLMGKRQVGELEPSELVMSLIIADLAAVPMQDYGIPLLTGIIPILALLSLTMMLSVLTMRSVTFRLLLCGRPSIIIRKGQMDIAEMRRNRLTVDELLEDLAESYENEAELAIHRLVAMIEPVMLLILGMVIGLILLGIMMPIWSMYDYMI